MTRNGTYLLLSPLLLLVLAACQLERVSVSTGTTPPGQPPIQIGITPGGGTGGGEQARVVEVIDGDTIDVEIDGEVVRVRYIGMNTPERDEVCSREATEANAALVSGQTVTMVRDVSNTDRFDRLLRYVYVGDIMVNAMLVQQGWAEAVQYPPDTAFFDSFVQLEQAAAAASIGCHPTGIFDDGTYTR
jgi:endonuclease YncB( thermonuclease family)